MKNRHVYVVLIAVLLAFATAPGGVAAAGPTQTTYTGDEIACELPEGGIVWLGEDNMLHGRDLVQACIDVADNPDLSGAATITINFNGTPWGWMVFYGQMWGTLRIENAGGYWEGNWVGVREQDGSSTIDAVLHGYGEYAGQLARTHFVRPTAIDLAHFTGVLLTPGG